MRRLILLSLLLVILTGCEGAVVFAPTPLPPDLSPLRYEHPSGAFTVNVPRNWSVYVQNTSVLASVSFSPPDSTQPVLTVSAANLGQPIDTAQLSGLVEQYQTLHRPDLNHYTEQNRQAMGDGSWRITGYRAEFGSLPEAVNTFVDASNTLIGVIEVVMSADNARQNELQTAINTFRINPEANLQPSELSTLAFVRHSTLEIQNVSAWSNGAGVFFVTGEVANFGDAPISDIPVQVSLYNPDGTIALESVDVPMGYGINPGGFAPFSLRFGEGQPPDSQRYTVTLGTLSSETRLFYGAGTLEWTDSSQFADDGALIVTGTVTNTGSTPVRDPLGIITVFDIEGKVIAAWFSPLPTPLLGIGVSADFEIRVPEIGGDPANYILEIQGLG